MCNAYGMAWMPDLQESTAAWRYKEMPFSSIPRTYPEEARMQRASGRSSHHNPPRLRKPRPRQGGDGHTIEAHDAGPDAGESRLPGALDH